MHITFKKLAFVAVLAIVTTGCAVVGERIHKGEIPQPTPPDPKLVASLEASPEEDAVRDRAQDIKAEEEYQKALKAVSEKDTPEMRRARRELQEEADKKASNEKREVRAKARSGLLGCKNDFVANEVWVDPSATSPTLGFVHSAMNIVNPTNRMLTIKQTAGRSGRIVVRNLCPGGSLTLFHKIGYTGGGYETVSYTAFATNEKGVVETSNSPQILLMASYGGYLYQTEYVANWEVRLQ